MNNNFLRINDSKTDFMLIGSPQQLSEVSIPFIIVGGSRMQPVNHARNLGVMFDASYISRITFSTQSVLPHLKSATKERSENILSALLKNSLSTHLLHLVLTWEIHFYLVFQMSNSLVFNAYKILLLVWSL